MIAQKENDGIVKLRIADNTGAKMAKCIKVLGGSKRRYARIGDVIVVAIKEATTKAKIVQARMLRYPHDVEKEKASIIRYNMLIIDALTHIKVFPIIPVLYRNNTRL